jgi:hypothetical protein
MLGLVLVVGLVALLLGGTMRGLTSYKDTVGIFDSKLVELDAVRDMKANLLLVSDLKAGMQRDSVRQQANAARAALGVYEQKLKETVQRRRDPDGGFDERQRIQAMQGYFNKLDAAIQDLDNPGINASLGDLRRTTDELYGAIYGTCSTGSPRPSPIRAAASPSSSRSRWAASY